MDLLDQLLAYEGTDARQKLKRWIGADGPVVRGRSFNAFDVEADIEAGTVRVFDALDGSTPPAEMTISEFNQRLANVP